MSLCVEIASPLLDSLASSRFRYVEIATPLLDSRIAQSLGRPDAHGVVLERGEGEDLEVALGIRREIVGWRGEGDLGGKSCCSKGYADSEEYRDSSHRSVWRRAFHLKRKATRSSAPATQAVGTQPGLPLELRRNVVVKPLQSRQVRGRGRASLILLAEGKPPKKQHKEAAKRLPLPSS